MVVWFGDDYCLDVGVAGGKGASLAGMTAEGLPVPPGFVVSSDALAECVDAERLRALARAGDHARAQALVREARPPDELAPAYARLGGCVAVRSSACAEDSEAASFAGQQETFLNVSGTREVERKVVECWASFFSERALFYRARKGLVDDIRMAVVVQAADSISFLDVNDGVVLRWLADGRATREQARAKLDYMLERIRIARARELALPLYERSVARLEAA